MNVSDARAKDLATELRWIAQRRLPETFKDSNSDDTDEKFPITAQRVQELEPERWERDPPGALIAVMRRAIASLVADETIPNCAISWQRTAAILFGFVKLPPRADGQRVNYDDYVAQAEEEARFSGSTRDFRRKVTAAVRQQIATILLDLIPEHVQIQERSLVTPDEEHPPTAYPRIHLKTDSGVSACLGVANVTAGSSAYYGVVDAAYDQVVKVVLTYFNDGPDQRDVGITPRLEVPTLVDGRWVITWPVAAGDSSASPSVKVNLKRADAKLVYIPGTAVWKRNVALPGQPLQVEAEIIADADVLAPSRPLDTLHWGDDYIGTLTALFRVQIPGIRIVVEARSPVNDNWLQELYVQPNTKLTVGLTVQNIGNTILYGVVAGNNLPPNAEYVAGSTVIAASLTDPGSSVPDGIVDSDYPTGDGRPPGRRVGVNLGTLTPGQEVVIRFEIQLGALAISNMRNVGFVSATGHNQHYNKLVIYTEPST